MENPRDGGAWWAAVYRVAQSQTRLKQLSRSSSSIFIINFKLIGWRRGVGCGVHLSMNTSVIHLQMHKFSQSTSYVLAGFLDHQTGTYGSMHNSVEQRKEGGKRRRERRMRPVSGGDGELKRG